MARVVSEAGEGVRTNRIVSINLAFGCVAIESKDRRLELGVWPGASAEASLRLFPREKLTALPSTIVAQHGQWRFIGVPVGVTDQAAIQGETKTMKESDISTTPKRDESVNPEAKAAADYGVVGITADHDGAGVLGQNSGGGHGVQGESVGSRSAVRGYNTGSNSHSDLDFRAGAGVVGESEEGVGVLGMGSTAGVFGYGETSTGVAVHGKALNTSAFAGKFEGKVAVIGTLSESSGAFKIDHPLDPENKYLYHSFIESPEMMNIYNGNVTTDDHGEAMVTLPDYFEALNRDFRYQLTVVGQFAQAIVASKIKDNGFTIKTDKPGVEVSWQVTGVRQDAYANAHRIEVEEEKPASERGRLLHPEAYGHAPQRIEDEDVSPEVKELLKKRREQLQQGRVAKTDRSERRG